MEEIEIDYKRIYKAGFYKDEYKYVPKIDEYNLDYTGKYISDDFHARLNKETSDTTVINSGVGSGKSKLGYDLMLEYANKGFVVIVASPFILLTEKDYKELQKRKTEDLKVVSYSSLTKDNIDSFADADIHVVTIHLLLGDPGLIGKAQTKYKQEYQNKIREYCIANMKKVVIFFDEVHESSSSFKPKLAYSNLYKWKDIVHKAFVLSATFTESSYLVLTLISGLTNNTLSIYNYQRKKIDKPANLHIRVTSKRYTSRNLAPLHDMIDVISEAVTKEKGLYIHTASKSLAEALSDITSNDPLSQYISELKPNILTSTDKGEFDVSRFNLGTRFGTGVNIGENSTYIVILPVVVSEEASTYGTFSNGYTSVIQTLARVRQGGDIYVYMYKPHKLIEGEYIGAVEGFLDNIDVAENLSFDDEYDLILSAYNEEYSNIDIVEDDGLYMDYMSNKKLSFVEFMLTRGHSESVQRYEAFGKGISPYLLKAAYTGQFCNCTLNSVRQIDAGESVARVTETSDLEKIINTTLLGFLEFYEDAEALKLLHLEMVKSLPNRGVAIPEPLIEEESNNAIESYPVFEVPDEINIKNLSLLTDNRLSIELKQQLEAAKQSNKIVYDGVVITEAFKGIHSFINRGLIDILYRSRYGKSINYTKEFYIRSSLWQASTKAKPALIKRVLSKDEKLKVKLLTHTYKELETVRQRFLNQINKQKEKPIDVHLIDIATERMVCRILTVLKKEDHFISNNIFSFLRALTFKYDVNGNLTFIGNCKDETNRRLIILRELKKLFIKTRRTSKAFTTSNSIEVEYFVSEIPLEKEGLRLYEYLSE